MATMGNLLHVVWTRSMASPAHGNLRFESSAFAPRDTNPLVAEGPDDLEERFECFLRSSVSVIELIGHNKIDRTDAKRSRSPR